MKSYLASDLKALNRQSVYKLFERHEELSRAQIARLTKISMPTVMKTISYFLDNGLVAEIGNGVSAMGRKPQMLQLKPTAYHSIGVDYEGTYLKAGLIDLRGGISYVLREETEGPFLSVMERQLPAMIERLICESGIDRATIAGMGLGVPAIVDVDKLIVSAAPTVGILNHINCKPILDSLSAGLQLPIYLENDANAAALGEYFLGMHDVSSDLLYISLGTGIGAGLIVRGNLCRGRQNFGGEIGFMVFEKDYITNPLSKGWLEERVSLQTLCHKYPFLKQFINDNLTGDVHGRELQELSDELAGYLALAISNVNCLLDLEIVVIGGYTIHLLGDRLVDAVNRYLARLSSCRLQCKKQHSTESSIVGSALLASKQKLQELFKAG